MACSKYLEQIKKQDFPVHYVRLGLTVYGTAILVPKQRVDKIRERVHKG